MSEIKFACPHCQQHIACPQDYADMCIVCPACGKPMLVPVLSATDAAQSHLCLVAAVPGPKRKLRSHLPLLDPWTEEAWEEHARTAGGGALARTPYWVVSVFGTLIVAAVLRASGAGWAAIITALIAGAALSGYLVARGSSFAGGYSSAGEAAGQVALTVFLLVLSVPFIALGLLLIGCAGCG